VVPTDVILAVEAPFSSRSELFKGCTFFIALVAVISAINGLIILFSRPLQGRSVLLFSAAMWLLWIALRVVQLARERGRIAQPSGHIRLTSTEIAVPSLLGRIDSIRWSDLKKVRLTRDTGGTIYYEFYSGDETPSIMIERSRVRDPEVLDRELETRAAGIERTFEWERQAPPPPVRERFEEIYPGDRFDVSLPPTGRTTLRGCAGLLLALAMVIGLAFQFPDVTIKWMSSGPGTAMVVAILLIGIFLAARPAKARMICAVDGLRVRAPRTSFPSFIRWSELRDYTYVSTGGRNPRRNLTVWSPEGSWKLQGIRIDHEDQFLSILRQRSTRKPQTFLERSAGARVDS
jgi:hypothetical protein